MIHSEARLLQVHRWYGEEILGAARELELKPQEGAGGDGGGGVGGDVLERLYGGGGGGGGGGGRQEEAVVEEEEEVEVGTMEAIHMLPTISSNNICNIHLTICNNQRCRLVLPV